MCVTPPSLTRPFYNILSQSLSLSPSYWQFLTLSSTIPLSHLLSLSLSRIVRVFKMRDLKLRPKQRSVIFWGCRQIETSISSDSWRQKMNLQLRQDRRDCESVLLRWRHRRRCRVDPKIYFPIFFRHIFLFDPDNWWMGECQKPIFQLSTKLNFKTFEAPILTSNYFELIY